MNILIMQLLALLNGDFLMSAVETTTFTSSVIHTNNNNNTHVSMYSSVYSQW